MTSWARLKLPSTWGSQCRSMPKASASSFPISWAGSNVGSWSILRAMLIILTLNPCLVRYSEMVAKPIG